MEYISRIIKLSLPVIFTIISHVAVAQEISGVVVDELDETLPYVTVVVDYTDTTAVFLTDSLGRFRFAPQKFPLTLRAKHYNLTSDFLQISSLSVDTLISIRLPINILELDELVFVGHKNPTKLIIGGLEYKMHENKRVQNENALQALNYVPLVNVDATGSITVQGSPSFSIYVNGRPDEIAQKQPNAFLESLSAADILKVEVITNTTNDSGPMASGKILNIVLKQKIVDGYVMNLSGGGNTQPSASGSFLGMINKNRFDVSLSYDYDLNGQRNQPAEINYIPSSSTKAEYTKHLLGDGDWHTHTIRAIIKYSIDSLNTVYADVHGRVAKTDRSGKEWNTYQNGIIDNSYIRNSNTATSGTVEANLIYRNYSKNDRNTERFTAGYHYTKNPDVRHLQQLYYENDIMNGRTYQLTDGGMDEHTGLMSYYFKIRPRHSMRFTLKDIYRMGTTRSEALSIGTNYSSMNYHNNIAEATASYSTSFKRMVVNIGANVDYDYFKMNTSQGDNSIHYNTRTLYFMPSVSIYWLPNNKNTLTLNYSTGILRPTVNQLNPFVGRETDRSISEGNPDLKAQYKHDLSLYHIYNGIHNLPIFTNIYYTKIRNVIHNYSLSNDDTIVSTYGNMGVSNQIGLMFNVQWNATNWLQMSADGGIGVQQLRSEDIGLKQNNLFYSVTPRCMFMLPKNFRVNLNGGLYLGAPNPWVKNSPTAIYSISAAKSFFSGRLNISLAANSPFNKYYKAISTTTLPSIKVQQVNYITARSFGVNLSYSFSTGKKVSVSRDQGLQSTDQSTGID